jgi:xanthine dehydrogenase YagT iron-sulfur-binding subunit
MTAVFGRDLLAQTPQQQAAAPDPRAAPPDKAKVRLTVNEQAHALELDPRTTLLDALRDHLGLPGTKKGCDHGQCGACTVLVNGVRMNSCLSLAVVRDGDRIVTVEGLAQDGKLHPVQQAFVKHDGFQCGFCTPGQICSTVGMLDELRRGLPSAVTANLAAMPEATALEIRERMSGNICRCSAYPNILAAIMDAHEGSAG